MAANKEWSKAELKASVDAYLQMLKWESQGVRYTKSKVNADLRAGPLHARTKGSIEFRMQNISAVMQDLGRSWIKGYKPAQNVGDRVKANIKLFVERQKETNPFTPKEAAGRAEYQSQVVEIPGRHASLSAKTPPKGQMKPTATLSPQKQYYRDPEVRDWVIGLSNGICEACGNDAPFKSKSGGAFLETHHMKRLADEGPDIIENTVAVCPNCHRRLHHSVDRLNYADQVLRKIDRLKRF
jgi:5-methylcytosine-specific restriction enzyme A